MEKESEIEFPEDAQEKENLQEVVKQMDLARTDALFDATLEKVKALDDTIPYDTELEVKKGRLAIAAGNIHVNSAKVKLGALRLLGYRDSLRKTKLAVQRKFRNEQRSGGDSKE